MVMSGGVWKAFFLLTSDLLIPYHQYTWLKYKKAKEVGPEESNVSLGQDSPSVKPLTCTLGHPSLSPSAD